MGTPPTGVALPPGSFLPGDAGVIPAEQYYEPGGTVVPSNGSVPSLIETPPTPEPGKSDGSTSIRKRRGDAILNVAVPVNARVYVNDRLTTTGGSFRSYVSRKLKSGKDYEFNVRAVISRDGQEVALDRRVVMRPGKTETLRFDFDKPVLTQLTVKVPEDATVKLCGNDTSANGRVRNYKTRLKPGQVWEQYDIDVSYERNGKTVTEKRTLSIKAGQKYVVDFSPANGLYVANSSK